MNDETMEKLLKVVNPFVMGALEEITPFDKKNEEEVNEIMKVALKTIEIATIISSKFYDIDQIKTDKLDSVLEAVSNKDYEKASDLLK